MQIYHLAEVKSLTKILSPCDQKKEKVDERDVS